MQFPDRAQEQSERHNLDMCYLNALWLVGGIVTSYTVTAIGTFASPPDQVTAISPEYSPGG